MLQGVATFLKNHRDKLVLRVPALNQRIDEFLEKAAVIEHLKTERKNIVMSTSLQKNETREGLANALMVLSDMLYAHHYKADRKETSETGENNNGKR